MGGVKLTHYPPARAARAPNPTPQNPGPTAQGVEPPKETRSTTRPAAAIMTRREIPAIRAFGGPRDAQTGAAGLAHWGRSFRHPDTSLRPLHRNPRPLLRPPYP